MVRRGWGMTSLKECLHHLGPDAYGHTSDIYCNASWDHMLCWPATPAGKTVKLPCPPIIPLDTSKFASRECGLNGTWIGANPSNYTECYTELVRQFHSQLLHSNISIQQIKDVLLGVRILETAGLTISLVSLTISTVIFCYFRSIRSNHRIRILRSLFISVLVYTVVLLLKNLDQMVAYYNGSRQFVADSSICTKRILCEFLLVVVELSKTAMFSWMLIQGLHLQITLLTVFNVTPNYKLYHGLGWGIPIVLVSIWGTVNGMLNHETCWYAYTHQSYFWILEGPRLGILAVNFSFLLNIIRLLISKMKNTRSTEKEQAKKAVKAMMILLPLLGANNLLNCFWPPIYTKALFIIWSYSSQFLSSFQGAFIAFFYCFLNSEVRHVLMLCWRRNRQKRMSSTSSGEGYSTRSASTHLVILTSHSVPTCNYSAGQGSKKDKGMSSTTSSNSSKECFLKISNT